MAYRKTIFLTLVVTIGAMVLGSVLVKTFAAKTPQKDGHDHQEDGHGSFEKGPRGGVFLEKDDFGVEITIFESNTEPQFRVYAYQAQKTLSPDQVKVRIELSRLGDKVEKFEFSPSGEYLSSPKTVDEPHSFAVKVHAQYKDHDYEWEYESYEGRTQISADLLTQYDVKISTVGPVTLNQRVEASGRVNLNEDKMQRVSPRYSGVVKEMRKHLGDTVRKGEVIAVIENNASLAFYEIRSQYEGTVLSKEATLGSSVTEKDVLYTIADLSSVWVDFNIYRMDFARLKVGQPIDISFDDANKTVRGQISYLSAIGMENTQTFLARVEIPNPKREILPGLFVHGSILVAQENIPLAVKLSALQSFRDWEVVFIKVDDIFEVRPIKLGRRDEEYAEVLTGLEPGDAYVSSNSFLIKADILKSGASHDH